MKARRLFVAGATGAVGQAVLSLAARRGLDLVPHVRPKSALKLAHPAVVALELDDPRLVEAMKGCTTVLQLIGTMRHRFAAGDTYESSDIGTTRLLIGAAKAVGVDHLVLLSAVGAGRPMGAYLKAKAQAEQLVKDSGLDFTIFRPSSFEDREGGTMPIARAFTRLFGLRRFEPIKVEQLASAIVHAAVSRAPLGVALEGEPLWAVVAEASR